MTALDRISERCSMSTSQAEFARTGLKNETDIKRREQRANTLGYKEGMAVAYNQSYMIMKEELERLKNRFQNGCLNIDDFGV